MKEHKLIQSYLLEKYFVSTAYRRSSAVELTEHWYYETMVWEWDAETKERGNVLLQESSGIGKESAIRNHFSICLEFTKKEREEKK
jgi:hypothetical protein